MFMMTLVLGVQWGDEGKGRIVDLLSKKADLIVRFNGGNNAGHTIVNEYGTFPLHLVPSGIFNPKSTCLITNGVVIDPEVLLSEIALIKKAKVKVTRRLLISPRAHVIMPYHKILDKLYEEAKGKGKTGTTGRGIGPVYADKVSYNGIRISDLLDARVFREKLKIQLKIKNKIIKALGGQVLNFDKVYKSYQKFAKGIKPFVKETFSMLHKGIDDKKEILFEGAQAVFLDNDWGTYPYVTASNIVSGAVTAGAGVPPKYIKRIIGVSKAYTTRVGEGPFPAEALNSFGVKLREKGHEFGTTTGRPRRCGWIDIELIRFANKLNGLTDLAITKLDVLDSFTTIKICIGYKLNGKFVHYEDGDTAFLQKVKPIYKQMKGWNKKTRGIKNFKELPKEAKIYIEEVEKLAGVKISYVSTGPERNEIIKRG